MLAGEVEYQSLGVPTILECDGSPEALAAVQDVLCRIVFCTNGCLNQVAFLKLLLPRSEPLDLVPVIGEDVFRFPSTDSIKELKLGRLRSSSASGAAITFSE